MNDLNFETKSAVIGMTFVMGLVWFGLAISCVAIGEFGEALLDIIVMLYQVLICYWQLRAISTREELEETQGLLDVTTQMLEEAREGKSNGK